MSALTIASQGMAPTRKRRTSIVPTGVLVLGIAYALLPIVWVAIAATKTNTQLDSYGAFQPGSSFWANLRALNSYQGGVFWTWMLNTALYAGGGAVLSAIVSALAGYGFSKYRFRAKGFLFTMILIGMLVPAVVLAIPQYLLVAKIGLADTYWSVLIPSIVSPYGIYLARLYAGASVPDEILEAARMDGSGEWRTFLRIGIPMMSPGLVTIFLFQFVAIWNNFLLPWLMLSSENKYPLTVGLFTLLDDGTSQPALYTLVLLGSLLSILPLILLFFLLQRFWRVDLGAGSVK
ncbi:carbohydrate ABC transporter permease [Actinospica sp. MGRD01-02]|uniref:Carbohydrate ABC transporter permease n=1 Tax=Actinospica acidithermotolerans TaxID=2828514 RepID=A0A941ENF6_9ACTN|nr:carbohydrate ABC transporter permease [Actinospica acidithermotolerans]MBR7830779.1 carbohydrate ABC transporter permease [Actinospica acidithermotolerans]